MNSSAPTNPVKSRGNFYTWVAVATFLIVFAGFARTYYLKALFGTPALPLLLHLHGLIFTLWFALFFIQVRLIARHRVDLHRRLGIFGAVLAPLAACMAMGVSIHAGRRSYLANPASFASHNLRPFALDLGSSLTFAFLVAAALYFRRRPGIHKRLMVLASCGLLLPGVGRLIERIPLHFLHAGGLWGMVGFTEITPVVCILYDTIKHRRLHPGFAWGGLVLLSSLPIFMIIGSTHVWLNFATWLVSR
ncbi:MAG TPA: hypothetical protein VGU63_12905 [Candidatus Acidoferrales bacterium]|nr:hypothetical protein [Candidatus Acidoferrales bacterium]